jgi:Fic family protein
MPILKKLPPEFNVDDVEILKAVNLANRALAQLDGLVFSLPNYDMLLHPLTAREAVASSEIENIRTTTLDILEAELSTNSHTLPRSQKETLNYREALLKGYRAVKENNFIATNSIVNIQHVLEPNNSGIRTQMGTVILDGFGTIVYEPPQNEREIRDLMDNLDNYTNLFEDGVDPLIKLAIIHYQFESIHPFYDGNGRTGRILMILYLVLAKRLKYPVLYLSGYILQNKNTYYTLLKNVTEESRWKEWVLFILEGVRVQSEETASRVRLMSELKLAWKKKLKHDYPKLYSFEVLDYLFGYAFYTQTHMNRQLDISRPTISKYLNKLLEDGLMKDKVSGKERLFYIPELLEILK